MGNSSIQWLNNYMIDQNSPMYSGELNASFMLLQASRPNAPVGTTAAGMVHPLKNGANENPGTLNNCFESGRSS